jgi:hypothetical protein
MITFICHSCAHYQKDLDPEGCFIECSTTGFFGKLMRKVFGKCDGFKEKVEVK